MTDTWEVTAVRYGTHANRKRHENFIGADPHDGDMPLDYFVWLIRNEERSIVVDVGFDEAEGKRRGRSVERAPRDGLAMLGIDSSKVRDVIITHLHYDHAGTIDHFAEASFHLQEREMHFATGPHMARRAFATPYTPDHVCNLVRKAFQGRVVFHDGDREIAPGVSVHLLGGHTMGLQCVRVRTRRGWVVLASDAAHFFENMEQSAPFPIVFSVADMLKGHDRIAGLADSADHIVPGHDPLVTTIYPAYSDALKGIVFRLDVDPRGR